MAVGGALIALALPWSAAGDILSRPLDFADPAWRVLRFDGKPETTFTPLGSSLVQVKTSRSSSFFYRQVSIDLRETPCLLWRWQVTESSIPATDMSQRGKDDRPLMVTVAFPFDSDRATLVERARHALIAGVTGRPPPGRVLAYTWGGAGQRGDQVASPQLDSAGMMRILRPSGSAHGVWFNEVVDLRAEFEAAFGYPAPAAIEVAVSGDSDDTQSRSSGLIGDLRFESACEVDAASLSGPSSRARN